MPKRTRIIGVLSLSIYYTMKKTYISLLICLFATCSWAQKLSFGSPFTNHMVLQCNAEVRIWGEGIPSKKVAIDFQGKHAEANVDQQGKWMISLQELKAGGPFKLYLSQNNDTLMLKDVLVGEVWLAGGQSNMQFRLDQEKNGNKHIKEANNGNIRYLFVPQKYYEGHKIKDSTMVWRKAVGKSAKRISAVAYFFAKELQEKLNVPVGIICDYKGGTPAEAWMNPAILNKNPELKSILKKYERIQQKYEKQGTTYEQLYTQYQKEFKAYKKEVKEGKNNAKRPSELMGKYNYKRPGGLYKTMLLPIEPFSVRGTIWYQGEANAARAEQYKTLFPALIEEWRNEFKNPNMPFFFVQLTNYDHPAYNRPAWAELREAQLDTWKNTPNTAMVVSIDCGEKNNLHPTYKEPIGHRLACCALNLVYNDKNVTYSGPIYEKADITDGKVILHFNFTESGLAYKGDRLKGFEICGSDGIYVEADAKIAGDTVIVYSRKVSDPKAVRYGWANYTEANLYNKDGFPASPFRTDARM